MKRKTGVVRELSLKMRQTRAPGSDRSESKRSTLREDTTSVAGAKRFDEEQWHRDMTTLRRAAEEIARRRPIPQSLEPRISVDSFDRLTASLNDSSLLDRGPVIRKLFSLDPERAATFLNITLQDCNPDDRQQLGLALESSGLVNEAIRNLTGNSHSRSYRAFSLLCLAAKAGVVRPLLRIIESHENTELRLALIRLLGASQAPDLVVQFQRLLANNSLPLELSLAAREVLANTTSKQSA